MGSFDSDVVLLTCGDGAAIDTAGSRTVAVAPRPERADLDPVLADPALRRLVVAGTDADLAAVLLRLLRTERLGIELAYVPLERRSTAARVWGVPTGSAAVELARHGVAQAVPLIRDDGGGVLVGRGEVRGPGGTAVHGEAYCDEVLVLRGSARRLVVTPWPGDVGGVAVRAGRFGGAPDGRLLAVPPTARSGRGAATGRAVQLGCQPATLIRDGVAHPRPVTRWAWYRNVGDWLLVRP